MSMAILFILSFLASSGFIYIGYLILFRPDILFSLVAGKYEKAAIGANDAYLSGDISTPYGDICGMKIVLEKSLPNMVLESRINDSVKGSTPFIIDKKQRFDLEGDFNKYFDFYTVKDGESFAMSVLTPDIMALLIDEATISDVIFHDKNLYLILNEKRLTIENRQSLLLIAESLVKKINHRLESWSTEDERKASNPHLSFVDDEHFKLSRSRISSGYVALWIGCGALGLIFWITAYITWQEEFASTSLKVYCLIVALLAFPISPLFFPLVRKYLLRRVQK